ncbi:superinfection exclusion B family protein [Roseobacter sp. YSTF-M11]|uniref:Superinfection exclusion B family protein n=1 Tax=Roseobacter insulae TaxID=2859783 RepID=A0A9X1FUE9_9RHOB|nr:super-infection exclusion protein B [Roseobacter insulae]MBW4707584.1 superinfection exclusion B family protein [Roseobacter insulae]
MFEGLLTSLSQLRPLAWRLALGLFFFSCLLLATPQNILKLLSLDSLVEAFRTETALTLFFSLSFLTVEVFDVAQKYFKNRYKNWVYRRNARQFILELSGDEKTVLKRFLEDDQSTIILSYSDGTANMLEGKNLITRSSSLGIPGGGDRFAYSIQPVALRIIKSEPTLLESG